MVPCAGDPGQVPRSPGKLGVLSSPSRVGPWHPQAEPILLQALVPLPSSLGKLQGMDRGHGALSRVPSVASGADFNVLSFPPKAADNPADDGFRAPNASLQAAASQLQGQ